MLKKWWVLASVGCGTFMATLDSSIVNIALPSLTAELGTDLARVKWVVIIYLFMITCLLLPFGRLSDQYGRKPVFQFGYLVFVLGSALCSASPSLGWLVFSRAIQAVGASMLMVNGPAIITHAFPGNERGSALGILAMVVSAGLISGPSIGGILISQFGWRSIFLINVPIGLMGIGLVYRFITIELPKVARLPFDWVGAILQTILFSTYIFAFDPPNISVSGGEAFVLSRWLMFAVTAVFLAIFLKVESDSVAPLFDFSLMRNRTFWTANLASFLTFVSFSSVSVLMPFFLEGVMKFPPHQAGLFMSAIPITIFVVAPISGRLSDRLGGQELSFAGALVSVIALLAMSGVFGHGIDENVSHGGIVVGLGTMGLAIGLFQSPNNNAIMGAVPLEKLGVASAIMATVRNLGLVTGTGLATGLFTWQLRSTSDFVYSLHFTHFVAAMVSVGAMFAALGKQRGRFVPKTETEGSA